jgi:1-aminocyclopropane-1-carboxylate synthase 1/2/6
MLSQRSLAHGSGASPLIDAHFKIQTDKFDPLTNVGGYINLSTAQNELVWDLIAPLLGRERALEARVSHYDVLHGTHAFRRALAGEWQVDADNIVVAAGTSALLDMLAFTLCERGEAVLIPAPYYAGFDSDFQRRAGVTPLPVPLEGLDARGLENAIARSPSKVRALVLTNPGNPIGRVLQKHVIDEAISVSGKLGLHCIVDEIYSHSVYGAARFESAVHRPEPHVHVLSGFAKNYAMSGFKVGFLHTRDAALLDHLKSLALFSSVSTLTQHVLTEFLEDKPALAAFRAENKRRLAAAAVHAREALLSIGVEAAPAESGFFLWLDLKKALIAPTFEAEQTLWTRLFNEAKISLSPGRVFHANEPGWFRLCFTQDTRTISEAVMRLGRALSAPTSPR